MTHRKRTRPSRNPVVRLGKDEDGAVMILTIILALLMAKVSLSTYNVGVMASERIRLQAVADTAAYSAATWQARFLNHCAYTRRAMIANYANVALITTMKSNYDLIEYYYDEKPLTLALCALFTIDPDEIPGPTRIAVTILYPLYKIVDKGLIEQSAPAMGRECAEHLSKMYSESQTVMYYYVNNPWITVVPEIVKASNADVNGKKMPQIDVSPAYAAWGVAQYAMDSDGMLNGSMLRQVDLDELQDDVEGRFDIFTKPGGPSLGPLGNIGALLSLPYVASRGYHGIPGIGTLLAWAMCEAECSPLFLVPCVGSLANDNVNFVTELTCFADDVDFSLANKKSESNDWFFPFLSGSYNNDCWYIPPNPFTGFEQVCGPSTVPIIDWENKNSTYNHKYGGSELQYYDLKENLEPSKSEPSVYVALRIKKSEFIGNGTDNAGKLFTNQGVPLGDQVQDMYAVSRAKVYFQPQYNTTVYGPNMYHAYWEAKLAPFFGGGYDDTTDPIKSNGRSLIAAIAAERMLSDPNTGTRATVLGKYIASDDWSKGVVY